MTAARALALDTDKILARVENGVGWIVFNQPERRNAMSLAMWQGLGDAAEQLQHDAEVRVVVMHGAGGKSFAAGADISEFDQHRANAAQKQRYGEIASRAHVGLARLSKPLIAMVEGFCIGGGLALALAADVRFATQGSTFGIPAAKLGLGYDYEGLAALARLVGPSAAKDMLFSARFLAADEALRIGLINFCVDDDCTLEQTVRDYAARIAGNAPLTVHAAKAAVRVFERYSQQEAGEVAALVDRCFDSADYREGRQAFMEKRPPQFTGH